MQQFDLDIASEYLLMAATLAHIKSRMLLPAPPAEPDDELAEEEQLDPRAELIRRLLEYQKYKEAAERLGARSIAGRDVFGRGTSAEQLGAMEEPAPLREVGLFALVDAFERILKKAKGNLIFEIDAERITINERITQITEVLRIRRTCLFEELFEGSTTRYELVVTFLAVLEMAKRRIAKVYQADFHSPIHLSFALLDAEESSIFPEAEYSHESISSPAAADYFANIHVDPFDEPLPLCEPTDAETAEEATDNPVQLEASSEIENESVEEHLVSEESAEAALEAADSPIQLETSPEIVNESVEELLVSEESAETAEEATDNPIELKSVSDTEGDLNDETLEPSVPTELSTPKSESYVAEIFSGTDAVSVPLGEEIRDLGGPNLAPSSTDSIIPIEADAKSEPSIEPKAAETQSPDEVMITSEISLEEDSDTLESFETIPQSADIPSDIREVSPVTDGEISEIFENAPESVESFPERGQVTESPSSDLDIREPESEHS
jgi:segregation and condensation protein A